jgi:DNA-binding NarL/FixJ family response regulator
VPPTRRHPDANVDGLEATRRLGAFPSPPRVLELTTFDHNEYVYEAMKSGASGFLLKDVRRGQLTDAIRKVVDGTCSSLRRSRVG